MSVARPHAHRLSRVALGAAAAAIVGVAAACSSDADNAAADAGAISTATAAADAGNAGPRVATRLLEPSAFAAAIAEPGTVLIDVRTPAEYAEGHLEKATNIDVQAADFGTRIAALDKTASYALYCRSGNRSRTAAEQMHAAGFTHVVDLAGGITAWTAAGNPVVTA